jgi:hypothetical protein
MVTAEDLPIILPTVAAGLGVAALLIKGVAIMWRTVRKVNRLLDQFLGEPASPELPMGRPSLMRQVQDMSDKLDEHLRMDHGTPPVMARSNTRARR